jgi:hypothetical protein
MRLEWSFAFFVSDRIGLSQLCLTIQPRMVEILAHII